MSPTDSLPLRNRITLGSALAVLIGLPLVSQLECSPGVEGLGVEETLDGGEVEGGVIEGPRRVLSLRINPDNDVLLVDLGKKAQRAFQVFALYSDGTREEVTGQAMLSLDNPMAGTISGASFESAVKNASKVEFTRITARHQIGGDSLSALANLTVVWLRQSGDAQDFFFSLPYNGPAQQKPLSFTTLIQSIDSFFAVDTTGSMAPEIIQLRDSLQNTIIPGVKAAAVKDAWFGVGAVEDFPVNPYGMANFRPGIGPDDQPFILLSAMSPDTNLARTKVGELLVGTAPRGNGRDIHEGQIEALYQIATGAGNVVGGVVNIPPNRAGIGGVAFRNGALPVITLITDARFHTKGEGGQCGARRLSDGAFVTEAGDYAGQVAAAAHTRAEALQALNKICAKVVGVSALLTSLAGFESDPNGICNATADLMSFARGTGALVPPEAWDLPMRPCPKGQCCTGLSGAGENPDGDGLCPLVFKVPMNGSGLGGQVTSGITQLARFASFEVVTSKHGTTMGDKGETLPMGKTSADFIKSIKPLDAMPPPPPPVIKAPVIQGDSFVGVTPGSVVRFTIEAKNDFHAPTGSPQVFHATIKIRAGGCTDLDERDVIILIPPEAPPLG